MIYRSCMVKVYEKPEDDAVSQGAVTTLDGMSQ